MQFIAFVPSHECQEVMSPTCDSTAVGAFIVINSSSVNSSAGASVEAEVVPPLTSPRSSISLCICLQKSRSTWLIVESS